jgi:hypothetical protein
MDLGRRLRGLALGYLVEALFEIRLAAAVLVADGQRNAPSKSGEDVNVY